MSRLISAHLPESMNMIKLANLFAAAMVCCTATACASPLSQVQYSVVVKDSNGKTVESRSTKGLLGSAHQTNAVRVTPIQCSLAPTSASKEVIEASYRDGLAITLVPLEEKAGVVTTAISVTEAKTNLGSVVNVKDCNVPIGTRSAETTDKVIPLPLGGQGTIRLASGLTIEVKLTDIESFNSTP